MELLGKINFSPKDILYVLGDAIDRGKDSIKCLRYIMEMPNIHMIMGNHEQMMLDALSSDFEKNSASMINWLENGGSTVITEFINLSGDERVTMLEFIVNLPLLQQCKVREQNFVLVHAGLNVSEASSSPGEISTAILLPKQQPDDLLWIRNMFFGKKALPKSITIFGHTPTITIEKHAEGKIWKDSHWNDKIGIDGGCVYGGSLLALRLDDMAEFAVAKHRN
jgi:serine/threonine protein phosphatase 1